MNPRFVAVFVETRETSSVKSAKIICVSLVQRVIRKEIYSEAMR